MTGIRGSMLLTCHELTPKILWITTKRGRRPRGMQFKAMRQQWHKPGETGMDSQPNHMDN
jgi:predicted SprT family Zn-dependent metalloprotease